MDNEEDVVMTPLHATSGTTVRVSRLQHLDSSMTPSVHHIAGGPYRGIFIMKRDDANPNLDADETRDFIAYVTDPKSRGRQNKENQGNIVKEKRELRFWFHDKDDSNAITADHYIEQLLNPRKFPKSSIGYVKRLITQIRSFPEIKVLEAEMRPLRPGEEDHLRLTRKRITRVIATTTITTSRRKKMQDDHLKEANRESVQNGEHIEGETVALMSSAPYGEKRDRRSHMKGLHGQDDWEQEEEDEGVVIEVVDTEGNVVRLTPEGDTREMEEYAMIVDKPTEDILRKKRKASGDSKSDEEGKEKPKRFSFFRRSKRESQLDKDKKEKEKQKKEEKKRKEEEKKREKELALLAKKDQKEKEKKEKEEKRKSARKDKDVVVPIVVIEEEEDEGDKDKKGKKKDRSSLCVPSDKKDDNSSVSSQEYIVAADGTKEPKKKKKDSKKKKVPTATLR